MPEVELSAGPIEYEDSGGDGPVLVFLHGLLMDGTLFDAVVRDLRSDHRCIVPTLPLGGHRRPMRPDADLSLAGFGRIVDEFLEILDLDDVTLVQNDHAAALVLAGERPERVGRLVISSCEAFDNYPPGLPGKNIALLARMPGGIYASMQLMRIRALRRLPVAWGWMTKRPIPHETTDAWFRPAQTQRAIRRDLARYAGGARKRDMLDVMERLRSFERPALVMWAAEDRVMPVEHGRRLAELLPDARLVEIVDSYTLIPLDQPSRFARHVRAFVAETRLAPKPLPRAV
jgi:pimeloyl-ACP methyl ester carboxylesterase